MATKLGLYNGALREIHETRLSSLTEDRGPRHELDQVYNDVVNWCLEQASWNFATRQVKLVRTGSGDTNFGRKYIFNKPDDWVLTVSLCQDEYYQIPIVNAVDRQDDWLCDLTEIYVEYVSDDEDWGYDLGKWPSTFELFVQRALAERIAGVVTGSEKARENVMKMMIKAKRDAMNKDARNDANPQMRPLGSWAATRVGHAQPRDRWTRS